MVDDGVAWQKSTTSCIVLKQCCTLIHHPNVLSPPMLCRYLLNLDGHTAAYRLGHLLATNSLVLKQESAQVEYYYK